MSSDKKDIAEAAAGATPVEAGEAAPINKNKKYRKEKPWDNDPTLDKWKVDEFKPEDNPNGLLEESSFAVLFP